MSKDIWHTSNEKPEQLRYYLEEYDRFSDVVVALRKKELLQNLELLANNVFK